MIILAIVTNRHETLDIIQELKNQGKNVCWISICNTYSFPLKCRSNKHTLILKFDDIHINPITIRQKRKIKNFIINHHKNMKDDYVLIINCHAGISRSAAIGMFCKYNLGINVQFRKETFPNTGVMLALGVNRTEWAKETTQFI